MIAITINNNFLKIAAPERNLFQKIPLDSSVVDDCKITNQEGFVALVEKSLTGVELPSKEVLVGLNEEKTYLLESASADDLSGLAPYEIDQLYVTQNPKIPQLAAVEKELVDGYLEVLQKLGFKVSGFVPLALTLAGLTKGQEKTHLIVCLEDNELVFVLVKEGGAVPFSATYPADNILESTTAVLEFSKEKYQITDIKKLYVCGEDAERVAEILKKAGLVVEVLDIKPPEFCKPVSLLQLDDQELVIHPGSVAPKYLKLPKLPKLFTRLNLRSNFGGPKLPKIPNRLFLLLGIFGLLGLVLAALVFTKIPKAAKPPEALIEVPEATESAEEVVPEVTASAEPLVSAYKIQVLNAKGIQGVAAKVRDKLEELGYQVTDIDNTPWRNDSVIKVKEGNEKLFETLTKDLEGEYNFTESETLEEESEFDAVVIIGMQ